MTYRPSRRLLSILATASLLFLTAAPATTAVATIGTSSATITPQVVGPALPTIASGLSKPVLVTNAGDGSGRLFVVEQTGRIRVIDGGVLLSKPFLDLSASVSRGGEQGLLGLAFHPSYETNGKFYVDFTTTSGDTAINEYRVSADANVADRSTGRRIITIAQPYANHNGGNIAFGPDGYLYIGMGDGGSAGDPGNRAQNVNSLLGKMLRIDINGKSGALQYRIPSGNPYIGKTGRDEIWSRGLRNPWRWSFDRLTGDLWIGDVGQNRYEEIDRSLVTDRASRGRGVNYGWRTIEGRACYRPATGCSTAGTVLPVLAYNHSSGDCSVIGGYVYRGSVSTTLAGRYLFADFCSGRIWSISRTVKAPAHRALFLDTGLNITSFGEGEDGELYVTSTDGRVRHIVAP
jgi:glucose/arabinose dehydrogenase